jgi:hypothetical protein
MPRQPAKPWEADVRRLWRAAREDGKEVVRTEISADGRIVVVHKADAQAPATPSPYDSWKVSHGSH